MIDMSNATAVALFMVVEDKTAPIIDRIFRVLGLARLKKKGRVRLRRVNV